MKCIKLTVVWLCVCIIESHSMSDNELEEFSEFLQKTSQLDQILKKDSKPDEEDVEEELLTDHAWEESGKFEGDLILNERQRRMIVQNVAEGLARNGLLDGTKKWPNNEVIYYIQKEHFSDDQVQAIQNGIEDIAQASCIKFRPYVRGDRDAVVVQGSRRGCFSQVGYQSGYQVLNLSGRHPVGQGCFRHGTVVHEFLHTLGFYHMQSSPDRDDFINVMWENIVQPARHNFRKYNSFAVTDFGVGYDYDSVLHYSRKAFSSNGQDTLVPKQSGASIGQRVGLSDKDTQKLNKMYCEADSNNNFEAEEAQKPPPKKEKENTKNKPFEGHGIGYHQGKTVVIKLPAAKTIQLSDMPTLLMFDYFSKAPETVPSTLSEGFRTRQEVDYSYAPEYNIPNNIKEETETKKSTVKASESENVSDKSNDRSHQDKKSHEKTVFENDSTNYQKPKGTESIEAHDDLNEAFERLGKIIKTHVYPSQAPNILSIFNNPDYKKFYNPERKYTLDPDVVKAEKKFNNDQSKRRDSLKVKEQASKDFINSLYLPRPFTKNLMPEKIIYNDYDHTIINTPKFNYTQAPEERDASYDTTYALRKTPRKEDKLKTPEYAKFENIKNKHNYSSLYSQPDHNKSHRFNGDYTTFGQAVPFNEDWYTKDEHKRKYDQDSYSFVPFTPKILHKSASISSNEKYSSLKGKPAYSLFGVLVPLTKDWFKVDYEPPKGSIGIEDQSESSEFASE